MIVRRGFNKDKYIFVAQSQMVQGMVNQRQVHGISAVSDQFLQWDISRLDLNGQDKDQILGLRKDSGWVRKVEALGRGNDRAHRLHLNCRENVHRQWHPLP
jgi:hypothetical protein